MAELTALGMVTTIEIDQAKPRPAKMGNPQPSPKGSDPYGCSSETKCWWAEKA